MCVLVSLLRLVFALLIGTACGLIFMHTVAVFVSVTVSVTVFVTVVRLQVRVPPLHGLRAAPSGGHG